MSIETRPDWHEYFMEIAQVVSMRATCRAVAVGAVLVRDRQILATGYNGPPSGESHCTDQGECYPGLTKCTDSKELPSRAIHAEVNAIAQAARQGISTKASVMYVTLAPCLSCLKLLIAADVRQVYFRDGEIPQSYQKFLSPQIGIQKLQRL